MTGRVRIAHVPYAKSLAIEKKKVIENVGKSVESKTMDNSKTAAQTAKSGVRIAHVPQVVRNYCFRINCKYTKLYYIICLGRALGSSVNSSRAITSSHAEISFECSSVLCEYDA